ncbi:hypothetical protein ABEW34_01850 [Paenibacillus algorifonticola]|uniref:hypothetical protein n=1 Tax=Paenibacillus algorifonticola TaxID=684063 RepID=UPI003D2A917B
MVNQNRTIGTNAAGQNIPDRVAAAAALMGQVRSAVPEVIGMSEQHRISELEAMRSVVGNEVIDFAIQNGQTAPVVALSFLQRKIQ